MFKQESFEVENDVKMALIRIGFRCNFVGFDFLCKAIEIVIKNPNLRHHLCKGVYAQIAQELEIEKSSCVERSIRHAIDNTFLNKNFTEINNMFNLPIYTVHDKPTAGELINLVAQYFNMGLHKQQVA